MSETIDGAGRGARGCRGTGLTPAPCGSMHGLRSAMHRLRWEERGASTAEYAVTTMAAVGFAGALLMLLRGDEVRSVLADLVRRALTVDG